MSDIDMIHELPIPTRLVVVVEFVHGNMESLSKSYS